MYIFEMCIVGIKINDNTMKKKLSWILCTFLLVHGLCAQRTLNFGATYRQPISTLPQSRTLPSKPVAKPLKGFSEALEALPNHAYCIANGWELIEAYKEKQGPWYPATVPGTILTTLVDRGVYPDPYWGLNNLAIPDTLCRMDWLYRNSFKTPLLQLGERITLVFNGINYEAEIYLNDTYLGNIRGAFVRGQFDVTQVLHKTGMNKLVVRIHPPHNPGIPFESNGESHGLNGGQLCLDGPTFISSEGWDWISGIRDRNIGIWQDVRLLIHGGVTLVDPYIITDLPLPDTTKADLTVKTSLVNHDAKAHTIKLHFNLGSASADFSIQLAAKEKKALTITPEEVSALHLNNPHLWWPNGYGAQALYTLKLTVINDVKSHTVPIKEKGDTLDVKSIRFGVREFDYELTAHSADQSFQRIIYNPIAACEDGKATFDNLKRTKFDQEVLTPLLLKTTADAGITLSADEAMSPYLVLCVNGKRIFCKGGNWGMDDGMKRVSKERLRPYFELHKEQHFTMIRNWTGESTEASFYDLCDEYGMLVLNDFWLSTEGFNLNVSDDQLFLANVKETVKRFRNHPSIALWCPRNEGFAPEHLERGIASILLHEDGTRHYLPSSILMNTKNSGPWNYELPEHYFEQSYGFNTEVGSPSIPLARTICKMMAKEDTWPIGDAWYYHDYLMGKWGKQSFMAVYKENIDR